MSNLSDYVSGAAIVISAISLIVSIVTRGRQEKYEKEKFSKEKLFERELDRLEKASSWARECYSVELLYTSQKRNNSKLIEGLENKARNLMLSAYDFQMIFKRLDVKNGAKEKDMPGIIESSFLTVVGVLNEIGKGVDLDNEIAVTACMDLFNRVEDEIEKLTKFNH